jgi:hypothetical protein
MLQTAMTTSADAQAAFLYLLRTAAEQACRYEKQARNFPSCSRVRVGKLFSENTARSLAKHLSGEVNVSIQALNDYITTMLSGRVDDQVIAELRNHFPAYADRIRMLKLYPSGQRSMTARDALRLLEKRLPTDFTLQDLVDPNGMTEITQALINDVRLSGANGDAVTNSLALVTYVESDHLIVTDELRALLLLKAASAGMYSAYQAGNVTVMARHIRALGRAAQTGDAEALITLKSAEHFRHELLGLPVKGREAASIAAMDVLFAAANGAAISRQTTDLSVIHNAVKTLIENNADIQTSLGNTRETIKDFVNAAPAMYHGHGHIEGAALSLVTAANAIVTSGGHIDDAIEKISEGMAMVKPSANGMYHTANGALAEYMGNLERRRSTGRHGRATTSPQAEIWYTAAQKAFQQSGSWQRADRVTAKLARVA